MLASVADFPTQPSPVGTIFAEGASDNASMTPDPEADAGYPIAHFADHLVELLVRPTSPVKIPVDPIDAPDAQRHTPGIKYLLTELLCNATGGPEVVTASGFDEAKLGVLPEQWPIFLAHATDAAARVFPTPHHRAMILSVTFASSGCPLQ